MNTIYVIVYSYDYKSIADNIYFPSYEEAYEWKKEQIANGECGNPISLYHFKALIPSSITIELAESK
jgi:hypothetical protein